MTAAGATSEEDREFALGLYKMYRNSIQDVQFDMDEQAGESASSTGVSTEGTEF